MMREVEYLSPTSISMFYSDRTEFYLHYLADNRPPRIPQTQAMSVGAAFDAYIKSYLAQALLGTVPEALEQGVIFESQVEEHNRVFAREAGRVCFEAYRTSGAISDLLGEMEDAAEEPRFEFTVECIIPHEKNIISLKLLGKPDVFFMTRLGAHVVIDWKVNGYCSKYGASPAKYYVKIRDGWKDGKHSRSHMKSHKDATPMMKDGIIIDVSNHLESANEDWARQLAIYGWVLGEDVGTPFIVGIDQLACKDGKIRVASHRTRVSTNYQMIIFEQALHAWNMIKSGHIFDDLSLEESISRCETLDDYYKAYSGDANDPKEDWFQRMTRSGE